ncbi:hypothetical protein Ga0609869_001049 [Rhodovulum iodosum]|uniref:Dihydrodipicolinate reductase n=1 Tax=Rhodovulum iodosum TaxID=68291 RepID=A0ABV3XQU4_9RHOB|nr:dihydrodipicolinate reductase [Rhodovulum robiginosum]RSK32880.1 dihydrodipicolinate reductase [Rhodovulum robiginosum]
MTRIAYIFAVAALTASPALAEGFQPVENRDSFVSLIDGRSLTRFGIRLEVSPRGDITGRAFGREVSGDWRWDGRYFCRDLTFGAESLGPNCQAVEVRGSTLRFIADKGAGQRADLRLD